MKPLLALLLVLADDAQPADLVIRIDHIDNNAGQVLVALYENAGSFPKLPLKNAVAPAQAGRTSVTFKDLPAGDYAFSVVHDVNGNDKVDRNLFGIPTEKYAFSNNALGRMGPPSFADARLSLPAAGAAGSTASIRTRQ